MGKAGLIQNSPRGAATPWRCKANTSTRFGYLYYTKMPKESKGLPTFFRPWIARNPSARPVPSFRFSGTMIRAANRVFRHTKSTIRATNIPIRQTKSIPLPPVFPYTPSPIILMHMARHMPGCFRTRKKTQEKRISSIYRVQRKRNTRCSAGKDEKLPGQGKGQYLRKPGRKEREKGYEKTEYCRKKRLYPDTG